jgi:hypothetical protein
MMTGQGGWPLNVFLAPEDLVPFYGGTYFPLEPRYGRPGFLQVLQALRRYYDTEKQDLRSRQEAILTAIQQAAILPNTQPLDAELLRQGIETSTGIITGGDYGTKFPMIPYADLALRGLRFFPVWEENFRYNLPHSCTQRGIDLALGGIYDHVGGGFHRYTVDPTWTVPHFEKMLYDNGQILEYLANLWSAGVREPAFERAIALTVKWLQREMTAPEGYFYAAQDADSFTHPAAAEPEEGAFYVWSYSELENILTPEELTALQAEFTVTPQGNFEGKNVLQRRQTGNLSETVETALQKLFQVRYGSTLAELNTFPPARNNQEAKTQTWAGRIPAVTDTKMIVAWNSLTISGLARAAVVFQQDDYLDLAVRAASFILENQWVDGRFHRLNYDGKAAVMAQSEDYAQFIKALLDLHQAELGGGRVGVGSRGREQRGRGAEEQRSRGELGHAPRTTHHAPRTTHNWLEKAIAAQAEFDEFLWSVELGGYYNTAQDTSQELIVRERSYTDNATPAANGVAIANLVRLALLTEDLTYLDRAEQGLQAFSSAMHQHPQACPSLFIAFDWYLHCTTIRTARDQINSLSSQYLPAAVLTLADDLPDSSVGLVCKGLTCLAPAETLEKMQEQIQQSQMRGI